MAAVACGVRRTTLIRSNTRRSRAVMRSPISGGGSAERSDLDGVRGGFFFLRFSFNFLPWILYSSQWVCKEAMR